MNVTHLLTADESALLEAYRRCCASHREGMRMFADAAVDRCASGSASPGVGCPHSVAPVEPARPQPVPLTIVSRRRRVRSARARAQPARLSLVR